MKKTNFRVLFLFLIPWNIIAQGEDNMVNLTSFDEICYKTYQHESMEISENIDFETLSMTDKFKMKGQYIEKYIYEGLDNNNLFFREASLIDHDNMYPKWYSPAYKVRTDIDGSTSFYTPDNTYLPGGWVGASVGQTAAGIYSFDQQSNNYVYMVPHSITSLEIQEIETEKITNYGAIYDYIFNFPSTSQLQNYSNNGFTINMEGQIRSISKDSFAMFWNEGEKIQWQIITEGSDTISSVSAFYKYSNDIGYDIISHTVTKVKTNFQNGDCGTKVIYRYYDEWNTQCENLDFRASNNNFEKNELEIYPNPSINEVNVTIPNSSESGRLQILTISGRVVLMRRVDPEQGSINIDISLLPKGLYILEYQVDNKFPFTSKLIKQ